MKLNIFVTLGLMLVLGTSAQFNFFGNRFRLPTFSRPQMPRLPRFRTFMRNVFSSPSRPAVVEQPVRTVSRPVVTGPVQPAAAPVSSPSSRPNSSSGSGNHQYQGRNYLLTWRTGQNGFSHSAAKSFCRSQGMRMVSLDNIGKAQHFMNLLESDNAPYFWAGGNISR